MKESYMDFLKSKMVVAPKSGIPINREEISDVLKPHQRDAVYWAVVGGRPHKKPKAYIKKCGHVIEIIETRRFLGFSTEEMGRGKDGRISRKTS